ncbi:Protein CBG00578 [Caenorhabditis briggsae]|uniref:Uncharacterized protein n=2 Tax=Caenorhabditis briggsae TaxID=6238 RepID=A0AAE9DHL9_CAEBR|nr:Protein CBG00578 [Caenorhabditis briggsae]ULU04549.1 hypothetical protein L3Y34_017366 [Caenorhabditis briggsae]CAP22050.2 Protein CBG00578 [Caenorhabditis briggsae]
MRFLLLAIFLVLDVNSFPKKKTQVYMATIDLDTDRKRHVDPEVVPDIESQLKPIAKNVTKPPDYGDYEDYELTAKPEEVVPTTVTPKVVKEHSLLDSQYKPHVKISMNNQKSSAEIRDEVSRLMGDLHREELTLRTTVTRDDMTSPSPVDMMLLGNETMFFNDEEGSGVMAEDQMASATSSTTRRPLLFTTLIQEVKNVSVTARPDPFEHLDYDLSDHSNLKKPTRDNPSNVRTVEKMKQVKLHGGSVDTDQPLNRVIPRPLSHKKTGNPIHSLLVTPQRVKPKRVYPVLKKSENRKKNLRKMKKIERSRRLKNLNHRVRAQNRMRLRKVLSKMLFGPRDSDVTSSKKIPANLTKNQSPRIPNSPRESTKLKFVGSNRIVTPQRKQNQNFNRKLKKPQIEFHQNRDKRDVTRQLQYVSEGAGGSWDTVDTVPIEKSVIESIPIDPHPYYHLKTDGRTQVEPSLLIKEDSIEEEEEEDGVDSETTNVIKVADSLPMKTRLIQVNLPKRLKMVTLKSVKKVSKKSQEKNASGVALVAPTANKPTMLELLIGDFLQRMPPIARNPRLIDEQWL